MACFIESSFKGSRYGMAGPVPWGSDPAPKTAVQAQVTAISLFSHYPRDLSLAPAPHLLRTNPCRTATPRRPRHRHAPKPFEPRPRPRPLSSRPQFLPV